MSFAQTDFEDPGSNKPGKVLCNVVVRPNVSYQSLATTVEKRHE
jgi:hypothetical protein